MAKIRIGTSGYDYQHWRNGVFYPREITQNRWLEFYAQHFDTVELNVSFYRLPKKETFAGWQERTPKTFIFAVKGSRFITHIKRLKECQEPLQLFFNHASALKEKMGIILWQLPPRFKVNLDRLDDFCKHLSSLSPNLRHAFEFRDNSWFCDDVYNLLKKYKASLCVAHSPNLPAIEVTTADFVYFRFHGGEVLYGSKYSKEELKQWAKKIRKHRQAGDDVYAYFNNDAYGYAIENALYLRKLTGEGSL